jgi:putative tricarboxylic transport membrane protein
MVGGVALLEALRMRDAWTGARLMPALVGATLVVLGLAHAGLPAVVGDWPDAGGRWRVASVLGLLALYGTVLPWLGFLPATLLFTLPLVRGLGAWSWPASLTATVVIAAACHVVFKQWLGMPLPAGPAGF